jgi:hypothetical protein
MDVRHSQDLDLNIARARLILAPATLFSIYVDVAKPDLTPWFRLTGGVLEIDRYAFVVLMLHLAYSGTVPVLTNPCADWTQSCTIAYLTLILSSTEAGQPHGYVMRPVYLAITRYLIGFLGQQARRCQDHALCRDRHDRYPAFFHHRFHAVVILQAARPASASTRSASIAINVRRNHG